MTPRSSCRKRKEKVEIDEQDAVQKVSRKRQRKNATPTEKRLFRYKPSCPAKIRERMERVLTQRFFLIDRRRNGEDLREEFKVLGSTGNVYTIIIDKIPSCNCPDASKGNHCKHILFVFLKVLNASLLTHYWYQKALLEVELASIFAAAPINPTVVANANIRKAFSKSEGKSTDTSTGEVSRRIPGEDDDCPICYESMGGADKVKHLTFCEQCGNALHTECFRQWAQTRKPLTCVWCRAEWITESSNGETDRLNEEGYLNLSSVAGISPVRDTSTYYDRFSYGSYRRSRYRDSYYC